MAKSSNVLLILTDQHRLSAVGAYGSTPCRTPNIDRLAHQGVRFENAYTVCPVCSPTRATIMTGQYPHAHGVTSNVTALGCSVHELEDRPSLLSRRLETAKYSLGYSGKWHLGTDEKTIFGRSNHPCLPRDVGFEGQNFPGHGSGGFNYPEYRQYLSEKGLQHKVKREEGTKVTTYAGELEGPLESTVPYFLAENTISLIDRFAQRNRPFFIWHNFWGPHEPYYATKEFVDMYRDVEIPPWPNYEWPSRSIPGPHHVNIHPDAERLTWNDWAVVIRYYYAFTSLIDSQIGRIVDYLEQTGLIDNTVIIFAADHGETLGSHGGLTDKGWHHFEETHRIPLIIRMPGSEYSGKVVSQFVSLADLYPTILEIAGVEWEPESIHGRSLMPLISGNSTTWRDMVVTEFGGVNHLALTQRTLRWGNLKYGYNCCCEDELYDLSMDPHETRNLIRHPDYQVVANELRKRLADWMAETKDPVLWRFSDRLKYYGGTGS